jgi:hypothetical protein
MLTFDLLTSNSIEVFLYLSPTHMKYSNWMKGSQDIERKASGLPTDLPTGAVARVAQWLERRVQRSDDPCVGDSNPTVDVGAGLSDETV